MVPVSKEIYMKMSSKVITVLAYRQQETGLLAHPWPNRINL